MLSLTFHMDSQENKFGLQYQGGCRQLVSCTSVSGSPAVGPWQNVENGRAGLGQNSTAV